MSDHYCESSDLQSRLTLAGFEWAVGLDGGDTVTTAEVTRYVTPAIARSDSEIDAAIGLRYDTALARGNEFLKYLAIDLVSLTTCTNGGRGAPDQFVADAKRARLTLAEIKAGLANVPGLTERECTLGIPSLYGVNGITVVNFGAGCV